MFERFTEHARRALFFARYEASELGGTVIETEHLLLGAVREKEPRARRILSNAHLSLEAVRREILARTSLAIREPPVPVSVEIPFSADVKRALEYTREEANRLQQHDIGIEHILLGLLRVEGSLAATILIEHGITPSSIREEMTRESPPAPARAKLFIVTALDGPHPGRRAVEEPQGAGSFASFSTIAATSTNDVRSFGPIGMTGTTMTGFCRMLEAFLDRPVIDETGLTGTYDLELTGEFALDDGIEPLARALRDQLGLVLTSDLG